jgi:hypothetical protein
MSKNELSFWLFFYKKRFSKVKLSFQTNFSCILPLSILCYFS